MQAKVDSRQSSTRKPTNATVPDKTAPKKAAAENRAPERPAPERPVKNKADVEISVDIAWPTPELVTPAPGPVRAPSTVSPAAAPQVAIPPAAATPLELAPEWALPELDIPLPDSREASWVANVTPFSPRCRAPDKGVGAEDRCAYPRCRAHSTEVIAPKAKARLSLPLHPRCAEGRQR